LKAHRLPDKRDLAKAFRTEGPFLDELSPEGPVVWRKDLCMNHRVWEIPFADQAPWRKKNIEGSQKEAADS